MKLGFLAAFLVSYAAWLFFNFSIGAQVLLLGLPVALLAATVSSKALFRELKASDFSPMRLVAFAVYAADFGVALLKANWFMVKIILSPKPSLRPAVFRLPLKAKSDFVVAGVSNSITLTPGTLTLEVEEGAEPHIYVHWIRAGTLETDGAKSEIVGNFEKNLKAVLE